MDRREFMGTVAATLLVAPRTAQAQRARKVPVVGILQIARVDLPNSPIEAFRKALRELGYVEGHTLTVEYRGAGGQPDALPGLAAELVRLKVDVLYAIAPAVVRAAREATTTIPIVALDLETDPVKSGLAQSLARPGGNITGSFLDFPALAGKWLQLIREVAPGTRRIALLWDTTTGPWQVAAARAAAQGFGLDVHVVEFDSADDIDQALRAAVKDGPRAVVLLSSPIASAGSKQIADFTTAHRLPGISPFAAFAEAGGLMAYGPNLPEAYRRGAIYVDKILKGAKPADLPIEQPGKFELVINLKTAKSLGLTIPQSLAALADRVIQ
jgi:putative tryptophan/tyrosine transport system substrate-binding protein